MILFDGNFCIFSRDQNVSYCFFFRLVYEKYKSLVHFFINIIDRKRNILSWSLHSLKNYSFHRMRFILYLSAIFFHKHILSWHTFYYIDTKKKRLELWFIRYASITHNFTSLSDIRNENDKRQPIPVTSICIIWRLWQRHERSVLLNAWHFSWVIFSIFY